MRRTWLGAMVVVVSVGTFGCGKLLEGLKKGKDAGTDDTTASAAPSAAPSASAAATASADPVASAAAAAENEPLVLPGSCIDPVKDAKKRYDVAQEVIEQDLDGDGKKDKVIHAAFGGMNDPYLLYVMRGTCGHFVGEVQSSGAPTFSGKKSKGLKSFDTAIHNPCVTDCGCFDSTIPFFFNGKTYTGGKQKDIPIPGSPPCDAGAAKAATSASAAPVAAGAFKQNDKIMVEWKGKNWPAVITQVVGPDKYKIHYDGFDNSWDEVVGPSRIKGKR